MMNNSYSIPTEQPEYHSQFWDMVRHNIGKTDILIQGYVLPHGTYTLPAISSDQLDKALEKTSLFRCIATFVRVYSHGYRIFAKDSEDMAMFVPDGTMIPIYDGIDDFNVNTVDSHKAAVFFKLDENFVRDDAFDIEDHLIRRLAKNFGRAEENACINGNGIDEPTGILHDVNGADIAVTADNLTYDTIIKLYFSVKPEYRKNAVWLMNDKTAFVLRKLKDADGNYLWNSSNDTILGKSVYISEFMPDAVFGGKPIAFGDFSYYWFINRSPISLGTISEKFAVNDQIGYLALEFMEGKLIRKDAVKVIFMK